MNTLPHTRAASLTAGLLALGLATTAVAQDCPRPALQWSNVVGGPNTNDIQVSAPQDFVPFTGLVSSAQLVHMTYEVEDDAAGNVESIAYRQSTDGGCSFGPEQIIWSGVAGQQVFFHRLVSTQNQVYVFVETDRDSTGSSNSDEYCWVVASNLQGAPGTFQTLLVSTGQDTLRSDGTDLNDVSTVVAAAGNGRAYVAFDASYDDDGAGSATGNDDIYFQRVSFSAAGNLQLDFPEEIRLETTAPGSIDSDFPLIAADGDLVTISWRDDRLGIDDDQWSRTSTDGGATFQGEVNHTNFRSSITQELSFVAVDDNSVYIMMTDERNTGISAQDEAILAISNAGGAPGSYVERVVSQSPAGLDVDIAQIAAAGGFVHVVYEDNRNGSDDWFVTSSANFGADFIAGTASETALTTGGTGVLTISSSRIPTGVASGDRAVFPYITGSGSANSLFVAYTTDGGVTWNTCTANDQSMTAGDTDDRSVALSIRGDLVVGMEDDRSGDNQVYTTGLRVPLLTLDPMTNEFMVTGASPSAAGQDVFLLTSITPPFCNNFPIDFFRGWQSDFVIDPTTSFFLSDPTANQTLNAQGEATFTGFLNFAPLFGITFHHAVFQFDFGTGLTTGLSDTITINP